MFTIRGIPTAGIAVGTAFVLQRRASAAATAAAGDPVAEAGRFHAALERAKAELSALAEGEAVFAAHLEMAGDPMLAGLVERRLAEKHLSAEQALGEACEEVCGMFAALDDEDVIFSLLEDLFTIREIKETSQRLAVARQLDAGKSYSAIEEATGASATTIARVSKCLSYGAGGYNAALNALDDAEKKRR